MAAFVSVKAAPAIAAPATATASAAPVARMPVADIIGALYRALAAANVTVGIDEAALALLARQLQHPAFASAEKQVASGVPATAGTAGYVALAFEAALAAGKISEDGHMNFFDRGLLKTVAADQVLATIHPPGAGVAGFRIDGEALPPQAGGVAKLKLGAGVALDDAGVVRATRGGVVLHKLGESLDVVSEHVHQGAVDLRSGHLDMQGSLVVKGDVERLLRARASGDLEVLGSVSGGTLRAGGSIRVSGNVRGGDGGRVVADHDVTTKSCEAAEITARGVIRVQESVNSRLCGQHIFVGGRVRGGAAIAELSLVVKEAGAANGVATLLHAGEPLKLPDVEDVQRTVVSQSLRRMAERRGVQQAFGSRGEGRGKGGKLGRVDSAAAAEELKELAERAAHRAHLEKGAVIDLGLAHGGVEVRIGSAQLSIEEPVRGLRYSLSVETGQLVAERIVA